MKKYFPVIIAFIIGAASTLYINNVSEVAKLKEEYKTAEKKLAEQLIEVEASSTAGVTPLQWKEYIKQVSININTLKMSKQTSFDETMKLIDVMNAMRGTSEVWDLTARCRYKENPKCVEEAALILFRNNNPIMNPSYKKDVDDRMILNVDNASFSEYLTTYKEDVRSDNSDSDPVSSMLSRTSSAIKNYFVLKGIYI